MADFEIQILQQKKGRELEKRVHQLGERIRKIWSYRGQDVDSQNTCICHTAHKCIKTSLQVVLFCFDVF